MRHGTAAELCRLCHFRPAAPLRCFACAMPRPDANQSQAEGRFLALLIHAGLPLPDEVERHTTELVFLWHATRVAVVVELDRDEMDDFDDFERAMIAGVEPKDWPLAG